MTTPAPRTRHRARPAYDGRPPVAPGSDSSAQMALELSKAGNLNAQREAVFRFIDQRGLVGATDKEIARATGISRQSICARIADLVNGPPPRVKRCSSIRREKCGVTFALWAYPAAAEKAEREAEGKV